MLRIPAFSRIFVILIEFSSFHEKYRGFPFFLTFFDLFTL